MNDTIPPIKEASGQKPEASTQAPKELDLAKEWYGLDEIEEIGTAEWVAKARGLFSEEELPSIGDYEFTLMGKKLVRRVRPELVRDVLPAGTAKRERKKGSRGGAESAEGEGMDGPDEVRRVASAGEARRAVQEISLDLLLPSPMKLRISRRYRPERIKELAENLRMLGVLQNLLVRPKGDRFEVVAGDRRFAAAPVAGLATLPCVVRELTDSQALSCIIAENMQREDLDPMEEALSCKQRMDMPRDDGSTYTYAEVAAEFPRKDGTIGATAQHVQNLVRLLRLPEKAKKALQDGEIGAAVGYLIAKQPSDEMRKRLTDEVLKGFGDGPMSHREVLDHVRRNYMVELRGSPFDTRNAKLVPVKEHVGERVAGGSCGDCNWNSANIAEADSGKVQKGSLGICTNPGCWWQKVKANVAAVKAEALAAGAVVIEGEKARKYVYHDGTPAYESGMVKLDQSPSAGEVTALKKVPTWGKMLAGEGTGEIVTGRSEDGTAIKGKVKGKINVPVTVVIDEKGRAHQMVERKTAIEAAKKNGFADLFSSRASRAKSSAGADQMAREAQERERRNLQSAIAIASLEELVVAISKNGVDEKTWVALLDVALFHAGADGEAFVCHRRELAVTKNGQGYPDREKALRGHFAALTPDRAPAFVVELLIGGWMKHSGVQAPGFLSLAKVYKLDVKAIEGRVKAGIAEKKKPKKKDKASGRQGDEEPVRARILRLAEPRGMTPLALNILAGRVLGKKVGLDAKPFDDARGGELTAILEAVDELTEYDPEDGWIELQATFQCPLCAGKMWEGAARSDRTMLGGTCACGYSGKIPEAKADEVQASVETEEDWLKTLLEAPMMSGAFDKAMDRAPDEILKKAIKKCPRPAENLRRADLQCALDRREVMRAEKGGEA